MGRPLLAALCLCSCILTVTPLLDEAQVGRATEYIRQHFTGYFPYQYAYFIKFTADECNRGLTTQVIQDALRGENAELMHQEVDAYRIYNGPRMVASSFQDIVHDNIQQTIHAEYRLLEGGNNSPIGRLMSAAPPAGCGILYSWLSPCVSRCLRPAGTYNIIDMLAPANLPQDKVFAFKKVYNPDKGQEQQVWASWRTLNNNIPLYRCTGNNCRRCFVNGVQQDECYNN